MTKPQEMYDIVQQTPLYQSWTRKALEEGRREGLEEGRREGLEKGLVRGKLEGMRQTLVSIVRVRFPRLVSLARKLLPPRVSTAIFSCPRKHVTPARYRGQGMRKRATRTGGIS